MSRHANLFEARAAFIRVKKQYEQESKAWVRAIAENYDPERDPDIPDDALIEEHVCSYFVSGWLRALNWSPSDGGEMAVTNLLREAPVRSVERQSRRRMDYLGFDQEDRRPLLVVEVKAPTYSLPLVVSPSAPAASLPTHTARLLADFLRGQATLTGRWPEWLATTRDYVASVQAAYGKAPERVVIMNDAWTVIFETPSNAFPLSANVDETGRR